MSNDLRVVSQQGNNLYLVEATPNRLPTRVILAHDYVRFQGLGSLYTKDGLFIQHSENFSSNALQLNSNITVPIRAFQKSVLPLLNNHEFLQPEHLKVRSGRNGTYPPYSHNRAAVQYTKDGKQWVDFYDKGESEPLTMTLKAYNTYVLPTLQRK